MHRRTRRDGTPHPCAPDEVDHAVDGLQLRAKSLIQPLAHPIFIIAGQGLAPILGKSPQAELAAGADEAVLEFLKRDRMADLTQYIEFDTTGNHLTVDQNTVAVKENGRRNRLAHAGFGFHSRSMLLSAIQVQRAAMAPKTHTE